MVRPDLVEGGLVMVTSNIETISCLEAGYSERSIQFLNNHFEALIHKQQIQGAIYLLAKEGKVFAQGAFGHLRYDDEKQKLNLDSIRGIASITKLFTATAIFQLVEKGLIHLNQPVATIIKEFDNALYNTISIKHLLSHTSGIIPDSGYYLEPYPVYIGEYRAFYEPEDKSNLTDEQRVDINKSWIKTIVAKRPICKPGEQWNYSSHGYRLLGEIISRVSGVHYNDYITDHIIKPLQLHRTFLSVPTELHDEVCAVNKWDLEFLSREYNEYEPARAGGGIYSIANDLFRFAQMLVNYGELDGVRILSRKSVEKMQLNILGEGLPAFSWGEKNPNKKFGLGAEPMKSIYFDSNVFGHEGSGRCKLMIDPQKKAVMLFFVPSNVDWCPESIIGTENIIGAGWL